MNRNNKVMLSGGSQIKKFRFSDYTPAKVANTAKVTVSKGYPPANQVNKKQTIKINNLSKGAKMDLKKLIGRQKKIPASIVLYTVPGWGKSTFATFMPKPIILDIDNSLRGLDVDTFPLITKFANFQEYISLLLNEKHDYKTVVIDSASSLERLIWTFFCKERSLKSIDDVAYYRGYKLVMQYWNGCLKMFDALRAKNMTILLLAHSDIIRFESPSMEAYDRYGLKLEKHPVGTITEWADYMFFGTYNIKISERGEGFNKKTFATGEGERIIYTEERPDFYAKKRTKMPFQIKIPIDKGWNTIAEYI